MARVGSKEAKKKSKIAVFVILICVCIGVIAFFAIRDNIDVIEEYVEESIEQTIEFELSDTDLTLESGTSYSLTVTILQNSDEYEIEYFSSDENIATVSDDGTITAIEEGQCSITVMIGEKSETITLTVEKSSPNIETIDGITYINGILVVNKTYSVPEDYAPGGLQDEAYNAFLELQQAAAEAGFTIDIISGYRSYETQSYLYSNYVATYGQAEADTFSAKPGNSEHQTGLAMDVGWIDDSYGDTPSGQWLAANCYKYGFIIRYPEGKEDITGYKYEPWHIRYLGVEIATDVYNSGLCLEEYLGID